MGRLAVLSALPLHRASHLIPVGTTLKGGSPSFSLYRPLTKAWGPPAHGGFLLFFSFFPGIFAGP